MNGYVTINDSLRETIQNSPLSMRSLSAWCHHGQSWLYQALRDHRMDAEDLVELCRIYEMDPGTVIEEDRNEMQGISGRLSSGKSTF